jgi:hypothetical protein
LGKARERAGSLRLRTCLIIKKDLIPGKQREVSGAWHDFRHFLNLKIMPKRKRKMKIMMRKRI